MLSHERAREITPRTALMRRGLLFALGLGLLLLVGVGVQRLWMRDDQVSSSTSRARMPQFELKMASGELFRSASLSGKWAIVHFWASWCAPCLGEIPNFVEFSQQWVGQPIQFVLVSLDASWTDAQKVLRSELPSHLVSVLDVSRKVPEQFGSYQYPETYLVSPQGEVVLKWVGPQEWDHPRFKKLLGQALLNN